MADKFKAPFSNLRAEHAKLQAEHVKVQKKQKRSKLYLIIVAVVAALLGYNTYDPDVLGKVVEDIFKAEDQPIEMPVEIIKDS